MSLRYAILGLLARDSLTGYDLTKQFDNTIGFFWSAKHSQIYPELAALTKEGLVTYELIQQTSKPNKKVYTITNSGREALVHWVGEDSDKRTIKDPLMMRVWSIGMAPPEDLLPQMREALEDYEQRAANLAEMVKELHAAGGNKQSRHNPELGRYLALRSGHAQYVAYCEWLREAIAELQRAAFAE